GTKLVTAYDQPALGGVYKLAGLQQPDGEWQFPIKLSEQAIKISTPGKQQVRRYFEHGEAAGDAIFDEFRPIPAESSMIDPLDPTRSRTFSAQSPFEDLLVPVVKAGSLCYTPPNLAEIQKRVTSQLALFPMASNALPIRTPTRSVWKANCTTSKPNKSWLCGGMNERCGPVAYRYPKRFLSRWRIGRC
ncbi:MAG: hypothetical protein KDC71_24660, partial [Acidobacteria bacterium]|nr:hypothetical protein [Acidobacteriota bacterium]